MKKNRTFPSLQAMGQLQEEILQGVCQASHFFDNWGHTLEESCAQALEKHLILSSFSKNQILGIQWVKNLVKELEKESKTVALEATLLLKCLLQEAIQNCKQGQDFFTSLANLEQFLPKIYEAFAKYSFPLTKVKKRIFVLEHLLPSWESIPPIFFPTLENLQNPTKIVFQKTSSFPKITKKLGRAFFFTLQRPKFLSNKKIYKTLQEPFCCFLDSYLTIEKLITIRKQLPGKAPIIFLVEKVEDAVLSTAFFQEQMNRPDLSILSWEKPLSKKEKKQLFSLLDLPQKNPKISIGRLQEAILQEDKAAFFPKQQNTSLDLITIFSLVETSFALLAPILEKALQFFTSFLEKGTLFPLIFSTIIASFYEKNASKNLWQNIAQCLMQQPKPVWYYDYWLQTKDPLNEIFYEKIRKEKREVFVPKAMVENALQKTFVTAKNILLLGSVIPS